MSFAQPWHLLFGVCFVAAFVWLYRLVERRSTRMARRYSNLAFLEQAVGPKSPIERLPFPLMATGVALLSIAWAQPSVMLKLPIHDGTVMFCLDTSGSMASSDVLPTRSEASKSATRHFVNLLAGGVRVGIVAFSTDAEVVLPPTVDHEAILEGIDKLPAPNGGTAIGDGLDLAGRSLPSDGHRAIVLLTDGVNNHGADPLEISHQLAEHHIPVFTVGIGTNDSGKLIPGTNEMADADPQALRQYADITGGTFAMANDSVKIAEAFATIAHGAIWERRQVDASLAVALTGGVSLIIAFLTAFALGKVP